MQAKTTFSIDRSQREAFLREELEVIRHELDELDPSENEITTLAERIEARSLPPLVAEERALAEAGSRQAAAFQPWEEAALGQPSEEVHQVAKVARPPLARSTLRLSLATPRPVYLAEFYELRRSSSGRCSSLEALAALPLLVPSQYSSWC